MEKQEMEKQKMKIQWKLETETKKKETQNDARVVARHSSLGIPELPPRPVFDYSLASLALLTGLCHKQCLVATGGSKGFGTKLLYPVDLGMRLSFASHIIASDQNCGGWSKYK